MNYMIFRNFPLKIKLTGFLLFKSLTRHGSGSTEHPEFLVWRLNFVVWVSLVTMTFI